VEEITVPAKKTPVKKKAPVKQKPMAFEAALMALEGQRHFQLVGGMDKDGNYIIDPKELEDLKKKLKALGINLDSVKFVALNAPFMRRSATT
jgi:hypothetical protein